MNNLRLLYLSNIFTLLGSSLLKIPLSLHFGDLWGLGSGFALVVIFQMLPSIIFSPLYSYLSSKFGITQSIKYSQIVAAFLGIILLVSVMTGNIYVQLASLFLCNTASQILKNQFPGLLRSLTDKKTDTRKQVANWSIASNISLVSSIMLGGILHSYLSLETFIVIDIITFLITYVLWHSFEKNSKKEKWIKVQNNQNFNIQKYSSFAIENINLASFFRSLAYGLFNCFIPVTILLHLNSTTSLGFFYLYLGILSIVGSLTAKKFTIKNNIVASLLVLFEILLIAVLIKFNGIYYYIAFSTILVLFTCFNQIGLLTRLMSQTDKEDSNMASSSYSLVTQLGMVISFTFFFLFNKQIGNDVFFYLIVGFSLMAYFFSQTTKDRTDDCKT